MPSKNPLVLDNGGLVVTALALLIAWTVIGGERMTCRWNAEVWACEARYRAPAMAVFGTRDARGGPGPRVAATRQSTGWAAAIEHQHFLAPTRWTRADVDDDVQRLEQFLDQPSTAELVMTSTAKPSRYWGRLAITALCLLAWATTALERWRHPPQ